MFQSIQNMKSIIFSYNFDTKNITDMEEMFSSCRSLEYINISNLNTQKVVNIRYMFSEC